MQGYLIDSYNFRIPRNVIEAALLEIHGNRPFRRVRRRMVATFLFPNWCWSWDSNCELVAYCIYFDQCIDCYSRYMLGN